MQKQKRILKSSNGRWTKTEHDRFMKGLERYGRDWVSVQKVVKTRTLTQVRSHAQKVFLKMSDKDIESLIANQNQYEVPLNVEDSVEEEVEKQSSENESNEQSKLPAKSETNLLDIFMKAIQQEQKQSGQLEEKTHFSNQLISQNNTFIPTIKIKPISEAQNEKQHKQHGNEKQHEDSIQPITTFISINDANSYGVFPIEVDLSEQKKTN